MKNLALLIVLSFLVLTVTAQKAINKNPDWGEGKVKTFKGHKIKRVKGENTKTKITNITYRTLKELIAEANSGSLRGDAKKKQIKKYKNYAQGGIVVFYVNRKNVNAVNLKNYTVIARDNSGKEVYKRVYKDKSGKVDAKIGGWGNSKNFEIKNNVEKPFTVEIQEKLSNGKTSIYQFEIIN